MFKKRKNWLLPSVAGVSGGLHLPCGYLMKRFTLHMLRNFERQHDLYRVSPDMASSLPIEVDSQELIIGKNLVMSIRNGKDGHLAEK